MEITDLDSSDIGLMEDLARLRGQFDIFADLAGGRDEMSTSPVADAPIAGESAAS